jgi:hypothetical protein
MRTPVAMKIFRYWWQRIFDVGEVGGGDGVSAEQVSEVHECSDGFYHVWRKVICDSGEIYLREDSGSVIPIGRNHNMHKLVPSWVVRVKSRPLGNRETQHCTQPGKRRVTEKILKKEKERKRITHPPGRHLLDDLEGAVLVGHRRWERDNRGKNAASS